MHRTGRDNIPVRKNQPNAETVKENEKMFKTMKKLQNVERITSSAEKDDWEYNKIQRINETKQKKNFCNATLLVNNLSIEVIIDSD